MSMNLMVSENLGNDVIVRFTTAARYVPSPFLASRSRRYDSSGHEEAYGSVIRRFPMGNPQATTGYENGLLLDTQVPLF